MSKNSKETSSEEAFELLSKVAGLDSFLTILDPQPESKLQKVEYLVKGRGHLVGTKPVDLLYFTVRDRGELCRLILEASGQPYKATYYTMGIDFVTNIKSTLPFGRVPVLLNFDGNGNHLTQSTAVTQYLARLTGLDGDNEASRAMCSMLFHQYLEVLGHPECWDSPVHLDSFSEKGDLLQKSYIELNRIEYAQLTPFQKGILGLKTFENLIMTSSSGFLIGSSLTYVDLALWNTLEELSYADRVPRWADEFKLPELGKFKARIDAVEGMRLYVASGRRMPRVQLDGFYKYKK